MRIWLDLEAFSYPTDPPESPRWSWSKIVSLAWCLDHGEDRWIAKIDDGRSLVKRWLREAEIIGGHGIAADMGWIMWQIPDLADLVFEAYAEGRVVCSLNDEVLIYGHRGVSLQPNQTGLAKVAGKRLGIKDKNDPWRVRYHLLHGLPISAKPPRLGRGWYHFSEIQDLPRTRYVVDTRVDPWRVSSSLESWTHEAALYAINDPWLARRCSDHQNLEYSRLEGIPDEWKIGDRIPGSAEAAIDDFWRSLAAGRGCLPDLPRVRRIRDDLSWRIDRLREALISEGLMRRGKSVVNPGFGPLFGNEGGPQKHVDKAPTADHRALRERVTRHLGDRAERTVPTDRAPDGQIKTGAEQLEEALTASRIAGEEDGALKLKVDHDRLRSLDNVLKKLDRPGRFTWRYTRKITGRSGAQGRRVSRHDGRRLIQEATGMNVQNVINFVKLMEIAYSIADARWEHDADVRRDGPRDGWIPVSEDGKKHAAVPMPDGSYMTPFAWARMVAIKTCMLPATAGFVWVFADYSQQEIVTFGIALDEILWMRRGYRGERPVSSVTKLLREGVCLHSLLGSLFLNTTLGTNFTWEEVDARRREGDPLCYKGRQFGKVGNFSRKGGAGATRLLHIARHNYGLVDATIDDIRTVIRLHDQVLHPETHLYFRYHNKHVRVRGGRMYQPVTGMSRGGARYSEANNFDFQSPAAGCNHYAGWLLTCASYLGRIPDGHNTDGRVIWTPAPVLKERSFRPVFYVHDEYGGDCESGGPGPHPEKSDETCAHVRAEEVRVEVERIMRLGFSRFFPGYEIKVEGDVQERWTK